MNSKAKEHLRKYYLHSEQRSVDGYSEQFLKNWQFSRSEKVLGTLVLISFAALVLIIFGSMIFNIINS